MPVVAAVTCSVALAAADVPKDEDTVSTLFGKLPMVNEVTLTLTVQLAPAPSVPPVKPTELPAAESEPEQVVLADGVVASDTLLGSVSLSVTAVAASVPGVVKV